MAGFVLSALLPVVGYWLLRTSTRLSAVDAAAVAAHYGSISIVTFVAATQALQALGLAYDGILVAVAAVMETPAILAALLLARTYDPSSADEPVNLKRLIHDSALNSSVVMLTGSFAIGWITGPKGLEIVAP